MQALEKEQKSVEGPGMVGIKSVDPKMSKPGISSPNSFGPTKQPPLMEISAREYAYGSLKPGTVAGANILWQPLLSLPNGTAKVPVEIPSGNSYRLLLFGHNPEGRLGFLQGSIGQAK
jgi:hypothetical protein